MDEAHGSLHETTLSTVPSQVDYPACKVLAGGWVDATSGLVYEDPGQV